MYILLVFLALGSVSAHDINVGSSTEGKKVFDEHFQASPAVWKQVQNVTINTTDDEVISRIVVTDLREDKDGDAKIVDGGEGQKKVTIELKSPTVLRGYDFNVEVYAAPNKEYQKQKSGLLPGDIKFDAPSLLYTPYPGSKITPPSSGDLTTKLPEIPKTLANPNNAEAKQNDARKTRDTEVKKLEDNKPKIESPSIFGQKAATTSKPNNRDGNIPVSIGNKQFNLDTEDDEKATEILTKKTNKDEVRHVRDTHEEDATTKNLPKHDSFNSKITTTTSKPPNYNLNSDITVTSHPVTVAQQGRDARATQKGDSENVSPTLISTQRNPTVYTPNFEGHVPSPINSETKNKDKPINDQFKIINHQIRSSRDTQAEIKEISTSKTDGFTKPAVANKHAENVTSDEERKARSTQEATSTIASSILVQQDDETSVSSAERQSSVKSPGTLTKSLNYPVPYPYEASTKTGSTTKSTFKRDTNSQDTKTDDDKNVKINPKSLSSFESATEIVSTTKSSHKSDTESEDSKAGNINVKINPKSFGTYETGTKVSLTTKSPLKRDIETSEDSKINDKNIKANPKSFSTYEASTKVSSTTKSPVKRGVESSQESKIDEQTFKVIPKGIGNQNATSHDHKVPVVSLQ